MDSDTESEGRSRPATPTPDERDVSDPTLAEESVVTDTAIGPPVAVEAMSTSSAGQCGSLQDQVMELDTLSEPPVTVGVTSTPSTGQCGSPEEQAMELNTEDPDGRAGPMKRKKKWSAPRLVKRHIMPWESIPEGAK